MQPDKMTKRTGAPRILAIIRMFSRDDFKHIYILYVHAPIHTDTHTDTRI